jgi:hypothetical protein
MKIPPYPPKTIPRTLTGGSLEKKLRQGPINTLSKLPQTNKMKHPAVVEKDTNGCFSLQA